MRIDCHECSMYQSSHCDDCLVTALLHPPNDVVEIDDELGPELDELTGAGLIPVLRFRPRLVDPEGASERTPDVADSA
jgi:hypothetical protein